jgi:glycosyltransferase involved in cell wall biosynthesis
MAAEDRRVLDIGVYGARAIPSTYSGFETFLTTLLPALAARGHRVTMYCRKGEAGGDATPYQGVQRVVLPALSGKQTSTLSHGALSSVRAAAAHHDVLLVVNPANAFFCWLNRALRQPVVLNVDGQEWLRGKWGPVARTVFRSAAWLSGRSASGLVADCRAMADVFAREFDAPCTVIPYCFPALAWTPSTDALQTRGLRPGGYLITGGRLNPENNIDGIAGAYAASDLELPLVVIGAANYDSPVRRELDALAARDARIRVLGHIEDRQAFLSLLHGAAAYVHGHSVGGMNPSLVEAMRAEALVVALDTVFNREVLGDTGYFFPGGIGRVGDLAGVLRDVLALDARVLEAQRTAARERAIREYSVESVTEAYERLLVAAAGAGRRTWVRIETRWSAPR